MNLAEKVAELEADRDFYREARDELLREKAWHAAEVRKAKAEAWDEAYRQGIEDERTAEELKVGIGVGGYATANRTNPYRDQDAAE